MGLSKGFVCTLIVGFLLSSCQMPTMLDPGQLEQGGVLRIATGSAHTSSFGPDLDMIIDYYEITGTGPQNASFVNTTNEGPFVVANLPIGEWTISATAYNGSGLAVGIGSDSILVEAGITKDLQLTVRPFDGVGSLELTVFWLSELVTSADIIALLVAADGSTTDLIFSFPTAGKASCTISTLQAGYYRVILQLLDGSTTVAGFVEVVRIAADSRTAGDYMFDNLNKTGLTFTVRAESFVIAWEPPELAITGYRIYARLYGTYSWTLLDEIAPAIKPEFTIGTDLLAYGEYELAVSSMNIDRESDLHSSMDDTAQPSAGWYVVWSAPT